MASNPGSGHQRTLTGPVRQGSEAELEEIEARLEAST
jgi:hypothetical protein